MGMEMQEKGAKADPAAAFSVAEAGFGDRTDIDDDGRERRTGTFARILLPSCIHACKL